MYLKRQKISKFWAIPRKGTKYLAVATHEQGEAIPLVVILRDILKIIRNKKELKKALNEKKIQINSKEIRETNYPVCLFDIINIPSFKKNYKAILSKQKKIIFEEVSDKEAETKTFKIINKKTLPKKKTQLNLMYGKNIISTEKANVGDSVVFNFKDNKIIKIIPMEKGKNAFVIKGRHAGNSGKIEDIMERGGKQIAKIVLGKDDGTEKINVWVKNIIAME